MKLAAAAVTVAPRRGVLLHRLALAGIVALLLGAPLAAAAAEADTAAAPAAAVLAAPPLLAPPAPADDPVRHYRQLGARHLYDTYRQRVFQGRLPPLLYAIAIIDVDLDADGNVVGAVVDREPASAKEVMPWILGLIHAASPFPKPGAPLRYRDIWLVDQTYTFQLDTLTEGQQ